MVDNKQADKDGQDWEMSGEYYQNDQDNAMSLEDFITEEGLRPELRPFVTPADGKLAKTIADVHLVLTLAGEGSSIEQIAAATGFDKQYIYNIQVCAQGFREDDEVAVAHLVLG